MTIQTRT